MTATIIRSARQAKRGHELTQRERDVAALIVEDKTNQEIADVLKLSPHTVKFHVLNLMVKLNTRSRIGIAVEWVRRYEKRHEHAQSGLLASV